MILNRILLICSLTIGWVAKGQDFGFTNESFDGVVELSEGQLLSGTLLYDVATGTVVLMNNEGKHIFNPRNASYFEYYDYGKNSYRKFYSLLYNNNPTFFELIYEAANIALLSKENLSSSQAISYLSDKNFKESENGSLYHSSETLFLADDRGNIQPYVVINNNKLGDNSNYITPYLLSALTKSKYNDLRKFAKQNRYSLKNKEHLIEVLAYYEDIK